MSASALTADQELRRDGLLIVIDTLQQLTSFVALFASLVSKALKKASAGLRSQPTRRFWLK